MPFSTIDGLQFEEDDHAVTALNQWLSKQQQGAATATLNPFVLNALTRRRPVVKTHFHSLQLECQRLGDLIPETLRKALLVAGKPRVLRPLRELEVLVESDNPAYILLNAAEPLYEPATYGGMTRRGEQAYYLYGPFTRKYRGSAVDDFVKALDMYDKMYDKDKHFGRCIPIIQSSGTGKSRLMDELAKTVPSVTICFRRDRQQYDFQDGWPPQDMVPRDYLMEKRLWARAEIAAAAFLGATSTFLNDICVQEAENLTPGRVPPWVTSFSLQNPAAPRNSKRHRSFLEINEIAEKLLAEHAGVLSRSYNADDTYYVEDKFSDGCIPPLPEAERISLWCQQIYRIMVSDAAEKLAATLRRHGHRFLVIGFNKCHYLNDHESLRDAGFTMSMLAMQRIIAAADEFSLEDFTFWFTFVSTNPSVFDLGPPREDYPSNNLRHGKDLLPPYMSIGFDQMVPPNLSTSPHVALSLDRLKMYGRPLWSAEVEDTLILQAFLKLFCAEVFVPMKVDHVLAAFSQQVGLKLARSEASARVALEGVRRHMRVLLAVGDRAYVESKVPSEPCLALAAARALRPSLMDLGVALDTLVKKLIMNDRLVDWNAHGFVKLYARLLLTLVRDQATDKDGKTEDYYVHKSQEYHVRTVTLADLLVQLHGDGGQRKSCQEDAQNPQSNMYQSLLEMAQQKHVNFTHFWHLEESCSHDQPVIDIIIVTYSGSLTSEWDDGNLGMFCIKTA
ncbi:hypothetical protein CONPUDRAFT_155332 [Coniophora puteana RWD-64-598 SS2]|uniref:Uncharacterized protein n=1 Tax=Coniophora puteana (strain RWD-64-598) TaxID=741705 RepID=A0A5M3MLT1_CONPW|nr:uncharacterized protein CONPUDRAFT_155332 [Coniophora puteana RWD-64-598 SS2]EIW79940.1 hypothetical protein CONPUDRAFT_155332 [Coniophora puteana RWD-64-598 SS2]